jgi:hypothetical protein
MKSLIKIILLYSFILFFVSTQLSQAQEYIEKHSKVKILIQDKSGLKELQKAGLSLEGMKLEENSVEIILSEREIQKLNELGFPYEVLIDDMTKYYQERSKRTESEMKNLERKMKKKKCIGGFGFGSMGGYYTFDEVVAELDSMRLLYPNLITEKDSIGGTIEGRTIWAVKISDNPDINEEEPEVFYNALIHAREPEGMMVVLYFMYYLLENYGTDPEITYLVDNRELYFVPVINPDGYLYNEQNYPTGGGLWRKNRRDNGNGCFGVDNNRNFGYMWGYNNIGSGPNPCDIDYRGTEAFSEFENQAIRDYCNNHNFLICNNYHSYWNVVFTPWGYNLTQTPDSTLFNHTISLATQFNGYLNGNFYLPGNYEVNGDVTDWMYGEQTTKPKIFSYLTEVGNDNDGFWPIPERIFPLAEENCYLNKVLAWGPGVIDNPPHIFEANCTPGYCLPSVDSITIIATESNPDDINNTVAQIIDEEDNVVDEFQLSKIDTNTYTGLWPVSVGEKFYRILLKQSGIEIPSNFYYQEKLKFTTAGPVELDSITWSYNSSFKQYSIGAYIHNKGNERTISNPLVSLVSDDSWVTYISAPRTYPSMPPGGSAGAGFIVRVDSTFPGYFNFKVNVGVEKWYYWEDSMTVIVTDVEDKIGIPISYKLFQNHPNPFNPTTTIKYEIPELSFVNLKIFNLIGEEITTLVSAEKPVGSYEIEFYAANLPSGIYFYRLQAGNYIDTKKMVLMK